MKALSIRQPWAWLIVTGEKNVENRGWASRYTGPLYIHAAQTFDEAGYKWVKKNFPRVKMPTPKAFVTGAIIGRVNMVGCADSSLICKSTWFTGPYGFIFDNPVKLETPIPCSGQLGFFEVDVNV
jgi:hypothetical protein